MRKGGGAAKGAAFEREIAGAVSSWISAGKRDDLVWRSAGSGSRATIRRRKGKSGASDEVGDLRAADPMAWPFFQRVAVECKCYADFGLLSLLDKRGKNKLLDFWKKLRAEASAAERLPMLIFRRNNGKTCVMLPLALIRHQDWYWTRDRLEVLGAVESEVAIMRLADMFHIMTPAAFCKAVDAYNGKT